MLFCLMVKYLAKGRYDTCELGDEEDEFEYLNTHNSQMLGANTVLGSIMIDSNHLKHDFGNPLNETNPREIPSFVESNG